MANFMRRGFIAIPGVCAIAWAIYVIPIYRAEASIADVTQRVLSGDKFSAGQLNAIKLLLEVAPVRPLQASTLSGIAIVRARLLEDEKAAARPPSAPDLLGLQMVVNSAIAQSPTNSFMWLTDFWLKRLHGELADSDLNLLRMSYWSGPNEAWIAARRNAIALSIFPSLNSALAEQALSEFVELVRSGLYQDASNILAGPGWAIHEQILGRLVEVEEADRRRFARVLASKDLDGVTVPGVDDRPSRPY
jgi:hypothetical protein